MDYSPKYIADQRLIEVSGQNFPGIASATSPYAGEIAILLFQSIYCSSRILTIRLSGSAAPQSNWSPTVKAAR